MNLRKNSFIAGFAVFSMMFGAGNLILPPYLGFNAGPSWWLVVIGFLVSAVVLPMLALVAHGKLQGTMYDFGKKVSPSFSVIYCFVIYAIALVLPCPRTAAVTHEMSIMPFFQSSSLLTSTVYFILVLIFSLNRSKVISILGKYLTPIIAIIILAIIGISIFSPHPQLTDTTYATPFISGMLEGYQTYDCIGGIVAGAVLIVSLGIAGQNDYSENKRLINRAALITGIGLSVIYTGLIISGAFSSGFFDSEISRTALLSGLSELTLGGVGATFLSVLVGLACFTTAVGIITGAADYFKGRYNDSQQIYIITVVIGCVLGVLMGQFDVHYIIVVAIPTLMLIYPITIILILLNVIPERYGSVSAFRAVVVVTILFSIPDFLSSMGMEEGMQGIKDIIPLGNMSLGWLVPSILVFAIISVMNLRLQKSYISDK